MRGYGVSSKKPLATTRLRRPGKQTTAAVGRAAGLGRMKATTTATKRVTKMQVTRKDVSSVESCSAAGIMQDDTNDFDAPTACRVSLLREVAQQQVEQGAARKAAMYEASITDMKTKLEVDGNGCGESEGAVRGVNQMNGRTMKQQDSESSEMSPKKKWKTSELKVEKGLAT